MLMQVISTRSFIKTRHLARVLRKVHPPVRMTGPRFVAWYLKTGDDMLSAICLKVYSPQDARDSNTTA